MLTKTIGILKADQIDEDLRDHFGDSEDMWINLFNEIGATHFKYRIYDVRKKEHPENLDECDGYLITGSRHGVYDDEDWIGALIELTKTLHWNRKKLVGICFGHQITATALGGEVRKSEKGWGVGVHKFSLEYPPRLVGMNLNLLCSHQDQVVVDPPGVPCWLSSPFCRNAGICLDDHVFTIQPHLEFPLEFAKHLIEVRRDELDDLADIALKSLSRPIDSKMVVRGLAGWLSAEPVKKFQETPKGEVLN